MRRQSRRAFYMDQADVEGIATGLHCLAETCRPTAITEAWLVAPSRYSLRGAVQEALGEEVVTALLFNNASAAVEGRLPIKYYTEDTLPYIAANIAILALCPTQRLLARLDNLNGVAAITLVSDDTELLVAWIEKWEANRAPALPSAPSHHPEKENPKLAGK